MCETEWSCPDQKWVACSNWITKNRLTVYRNVGKVKRKQGAGCQWLMPVIQATWGTEIRGIAVQGQPGKKRFARPHLNRKKLGMVGHACHPSDGRKCK
jgi:hypothetical protein